MKIIGSFVSPYVRKVLACLELKGLAYEVDPITPFFGSDEFERLSPLRRIPVLVSDDLVISDSSVICAWLDEAYPERPLLPTSPNDRARARWLEEYADSRLGDIFIWGLFYQLKVRPLVWDEEPDRDRVERTIQVHIPRELDYLERELPQNGFLYGDIGLADVSIASFFRNADYAGFTVDSARWPRTASFVNRALEQPCFDKLHRFEQIQLSSDIPRRRQALLEAGAPLTTETLGQRVPRRGLMRL